MLGRKVQPAISRELRRLLASAAIASWRHATQEEGEIPGWLQEGPRKEQWSPHQRDKKEGRSSFGRVGSSHDNISLDAASFGGLT